MNIIICKHIHRVHSITQTQTSIRTVDQARQSHLSPTTREHVSNKDPSSEQFLLNEGDDFDSLEYAAESLIPYQQGIMYTDVHILIIHMHTPRVPIWVAHILCPYP